MTEPIFSATGLAVHVAGRPPRVLQKDLQIELVPGELVALTGPSGAGKTTVLRTLAGLQDAAAGSLLLQGKSPDQWGWPIYRRKVLLSAQQPALLDTTVEANLRHPFSYRMSEGTFDVARARTLLERMGLPAEVMEQNARSLSVGQQQRVCLVRALLLKPLVLCLDEPTSALDPDSVELAQAMIGETAAELHLAVLIVTHNQDQASNWCSRRIALPAAAPIQSDGANGK